MLVASAGAAGQPGLVTPPGQQPDRPVRGMLVDEMGVARATGRPAQALRAATVLLLLRVPERAVMDVMGWSHSAMTKRYEHVTDVLRRDIAARIDGLLWSATETGTETEG